MGTWSSVVHTGEGLSVVVYCRGAFDKKVYMQNQSSISDILTIYIMCSTNVYFFKNNIKIETRVRMFSIPHSPAPFQSDGILNISNVSFAEEREISTVDSKFSFRSRNKTLQVNAPVI